MVRNGPKARRMEILVVDDHSLVRDALKPILAELAEDVHVSESSTFNGMIEAASRIRSLDLSVRDRQLNVTMPQ